MKLIFDALRLRLIEIGEAVKRLSPALLSSEPDLPWEEIHAGMRDRLAHRYFDTSHAIVQATIDNDIPELGLAVQRLLLQTSLNPGRPSKGSERVDRSVEHRGDGSLGPRRTRSRPTSSNFTATNAANIAFIAVRGSD